MIDGEAATDADGRFRVEGLVPGLKYLFNIGAYTKQTLTVESGKTRDLGELKEASENGAKE